MSKLKWVDISVRRRGDVNAAVNATEVQIANLSLRVHRWFGANPTQWFGTVHGIEGVRGMQLLKPGASLEEAQARLITIVKTLVENLSQALLKCE